MSNNFEFFDIYLLDATYDTVDIVIRHNKYFTDSNRISYNPMIKEKLNSTEQKMFTRFKNHVNRVYDLILTDGSIEHNLTEKKRLRKVLTNKKNRFIQSDFTANIDGYKVPCHAWIGRHEAMKGLYGFNQKVIL